MYCILIIALKWILGYFVCAQNNTSEDLYQLGGKGKWEAETRYLIIDQWPLQGVPALVA